MPAQYERLIYGVGLLFVIVPVGLLCDHLEMGLPGWTAVVALGIGLYTWGFIRLARRWRRREQ